MTASESRREPPQPSRLLKKKNMHAPEVETGLAHLWSQALSRAGRDTDLRAPTARIASTRVIRVMTAFGVGWVTPRSGQAPLRCWGRSPPGGS